MLIYFRSKHVLTMDQLHSMTITLLSKALIYDENLLTVIRFYRYYISAV